MLKERRSGIVMHISSLPNEYGIGTMGEEAFQFVDFLKKSGQTYWQVLPLSPTGFGDSPYQSCSARAGNPYLIDLDLLYEEGLLQRGDYQFVDFGQHPDRVDFGKLYENRLNVLRIAYSNRDETYDAPVGIFRRKNAAWIEDYALFMALKESFGMKPLKEWPDAACIRRDAKTLAKYRKSLANDIDFHIFVQYLFFTQWSALKKYANDNGIYIIGDIPIYVSEDSVEVWSEKELFLLKEPGVPKVVAGVPPDFYSDDGQLWGNPIYDWAAHEENGFSWWIDRIRHAHHFYDVIRVDHFRGFHTYWEVEAGAKTAIEGKWRKGPAEKFVKAVRKALPKVAIIAEDLGDLDDEVRAFFKETGLPGMNILVNGFDPNGDSEHMPHNTSSKKILYTSSHDSPTFIDWLFREAGSEERQFAIDYMRLRDSEGINWGALKCAWSTTAKLVMSPMQDVLGLGGDSRMNHPGTLGGRNWCWRMRTEAMNDDVAGRLHAITKTYRRMPLKDPESEKKIKLKKETTA